MIAKETALVLGSGEVYFDRFNNPTDKVGQGERYIGSTSSFVIERSFASSQVMKSFGGKRYVDREIFEQESAVVSITTDNLDEDNVALWMSSAPSSVKSLALDSHTETIVVRRGRSYQLGKSINPLGVKSLLRCIVRRNATVIAALNNYEIDFEKGRVSIAATAPDISNGDTLTFVIDARGQTRVSAASKAEEIVGSLRFVARNIVGPNRDAFFPMVSIRPDGANEKKSESWATLRYIATARFINRRSALYYVDELTEVMITADEAAITELGGISIEVFPYWEDQLDFLVNAIMPSRGY